jgi:hypothetical protein
VQCPLCFFDVAGLPLRSVEDPNDAVVLAHLRVLAAHGGVQAYNHSVADFTSFFGPLTVVDPGIVDARLWHQDTEPDSPLSPRVGQSLVGVARVR